MASVDYRRTPDRFCHKGFGAPHLSPAVEHPLHAGQAVDHRGLAAVQRQLVGQQRDGQPAQVADVLTDGEGAVDVVSAVQLARDVGLVLLDQRLGAGTELAAVVVGPPVDEVAVAVVLGALIVEAGPISWPITAPIPP